MEAGDPSVLECPPVVANADPSIPLPTVAAVRERLAALQAEAALLRRLLRLLTRLGAVPTAR